MGSELSKLEALNKDRMGEIFFTNVDGLVTQRQVPNWKRGKIAKEGKKGYQGEKYELVTEVRIVTYRGKEDEATLGRHEQNNLKIM